MKRKHNSLRQVFDLEKSIIIFSVFIKIIWKGIKGLQGNFIDTSWGRSTFFFQIESLPLIYI